MALPDKFRFTVPRFRPATSEDHDENLRGLERCINGLPFSKIRGIFTADIVVASHASNSTDATSITTIQNDGFEIDGGSIIIPDPATYRIIFKANYPHNATGNRRAARLNSDITPDLLSVAGQPGALTNYLWGASDMGDFPLIKGEELTPSGSQDSGGSLTLSVRISIEELLLAA